MKYKNEQKLAAMVTEQNQRIAYKCAQLLQERYDAIEQARIEKHVLNDFKKQHPFFRCWFEKHLRQTIADIKVSINTHMQNSEALLNQKNSLESTCFYL